MSESLAILDPSFRGLGTESDATDKFGDDFRVSKSLDPIYSTPGFFSISVSGEPVSMSLNEAQVIVATALHPRQTRVRYKSSHNFFDLIEQTHSSFVGSGISVGGRILLELINKRNGKVFYLVPPERDQSGNELDPSKEYEVKLKKNVLTGHFRYEFLLREQPKNMTESEVDELLKKLAE